MVIQTSAAFEKEFKKLSKDNRELSKKKLELFLERPSHPSLRIKRVKGYVEDPSIFELSINMSLRVTFQRYSEFIYLRHIGTHEIFRAP